MFEVDEIFFKSTLVSQLNGNPTLSKHMLTQVWQGVYFSKDMKMHSTMNESSFELGLDCVIYFIKDQDVVSYCKA